MSGPPSPTTHCRRFETGYLRLLENSGPFASEGRAGTYTRGGEGRYTENIVQLVWRNGLYDGGNMKSSAGLSVTVISPGRFNRSAGPDFKNAVLEIGGLRVAGDVEIHKHAREWYEHKHHLSPLYNRTVLHVFVERSENTTPAVTKKGKAVHELEIGLYLRHHIEELGTEVESAEAPVSGRPFTPPCAAQLRGLAPDTVEKLLDFVGDGRALLKSNRVMARLPAATLDQVFYETLSEALGHSRFTAQFGAIARALPLEQLKKIAGAARAVSPRATAREALFRVAGLFEAGQEDGGTGPGNETIRPIFGKSDWPLARCRPANYPHRRIGALSALALDPVFSAAAMREKISALPLGASQAQARQFARELKETFCRLSDEFWDLHYTFRRPSKTPKKLVGADKAASLITDCVIPVLLAAARRENDFDMEHRLVLVYHSMPSPSSNAVLDFMCKTVLGAEHAGATRSVPRQQALLQIYKDFCHGSPASCGECPFVEYLKSLRAGQKNRSHSPEDATARGVP